MAAAVYRNALAVQSMLLEYRIEQVLGAGGFGITYRARDVNLDKDVAIKEYLPGELAMRTPDGNVVAQTTEREAGYKWGLDRFLQEARTLARFSHPHIVRVLRYFEAHATAYMVMDYEKGDSLKTALQLDPQPPEAKLKAMLAPLLDGLATTHAAGFLHRDIKPDNIFIRADGAPVLIDFGAARQALGGETKSLTSILTPGYAPLEQYSGEGKQGPWTDLYAMGGVLFRAVTDKNPPDAVSRMRGDSLGAGLAGARGKYSQPFLAAIEWALQLDEKKRPQSVAEWRSAILAERRVSAPIQRDPDLERRATSAAMRARQQRGPRRWPYVVGVILLAALALDVWHRNRVNRLEAEQQRLQQAEQRDEQERRARHLAARREREEAERALAAAQNEPVPPTPAAPAATAPPPAAAERASGQKTAPASADEQTIREFRMADTNGDGFLSLDEARAKFPYLAREFNRVDRNGDGKISLQELAYAKRLMQEKRFGK